MATPLLSGLHVAPLSRDSKKPTRSGNRTAARRRLRCGLPLKVASPLAANAPSTMLAIENWISPELRSGMVTVAFYSAGVQTRIASAGCAAGSSIRIVNQDG